MVRLSLLALAASANQQLHSYGHCATLHPQHLTVVRWLWWPAQIEAMTMYHLATAASDATAVNMLPLHLNVLLQTL